MNKKKIVSLFLVLVLVVASVSVVCADSYSWDDDWNSSVASAYGEASCSAGSADASTYCYSSSGVVISTSAVVEAVYQYRIPGEFEYYTESDYETDATMAEVSFSCGQGYESMFIDCYFSASYTAYGSHGEVYTDSYSDSETVNY